MAVSVFDTLSVEDKEYLALIYYEEGITHDQKMEILSKKLSETGKFDVAPRTIRLWWKEKLNLSERDDKLCFQLQKARDREVPDVDILLFTSAQNKTHINRNMLLSMETYRDYIISLGFTCAIIISPQRYRNPTNPVEYEQTRGSKSGSKKGRKYQPGDWWVDEVQPYLHYKKIQFGDTKLSTNSRIRPTAENPMRGYEVLAKNNNLVLPHSRIHFKTLPRLVKSGAPLRSMSTTGYITHKNYSESKAGEKGFEHHSYGFTVIEKKKDGVCHIPRNVRVKQDGSFIDLKFSVSPGKVETIKSTKGIVWGDIHDEVRNQEVSDYTLGVLYPIFNPKETILHDVLDGYSFNPHELKDMYIQKKKIKEGKHKIKREVKNTFKFIKEVKETGSAVNVVQSNHDVFLDRHINGFDWKKDLHNSETYLKYAKIQQTKDMEKYGGIYGYLLHKKFNGEVEYLKYGDSLMVGGREVAMHADFGTNGAKGSPQTFRKSNAKMTGAHGHSPLILDGYTQVGTTCDHRQYYTRKGLSSWAYAHDIIHENNKDQLLVFGDDLKISELL